MLKRTGVIALLGCNLAGAGVGAWAAVHPCGEILIGQAQTRRWVLAELPYPMDLHRMQATSDEALLFMRQSAGINHSITLQKWNLSPGLDNRFSSTRTYVPWSTPEYEIEFHRVPTHSADAKWVATPTGEALSESYLLHPVDEPPTRGTKVKFDILLGDGNKTDDASQSLDSEWSEIFPERPAAALESTEVPHLAFSPDNRLLMAWNEFAYEVKSVSTGRTLLLQKTGKLEFKHCAWTPEGSLILVHSNGRVETVGIDGALKSEALIRGWNGSGYGQAAALVRFGAEPVLLVSRGFRIAGGPGTPVNEPQYEVLHPNGLVPLGRFQFELPFGHVLAWHEILSNGFILVATVPFYADGETEARLFVLNARQMWRTGEWQVAVPTESMEQRP